MNKFSSLDFNGDKKKIHNEQPIIEQKQPIIEQKQPIIEQKQPQLEQDINEIKILKSNINEKEYYDALFM